MASVGDRYERVGVLGRGAMATVFLVFDRVRQHHVALKQVRTPSPRALLRFKREFRAVHKLQHPNLVQLHELGEDEEGVYITMEAIDGVDLASYCAAGDAVARAGSALPQLLDALAFLHGSGVVHRDLKPANVLVRHDGVVKLLDFGLLAELSSPEPVTTAVVAGTPTYMAPEQIRGEAPTPASDVYALGVTLFELIAGRPPFEGTLDEVVDGHLRRNAPRLGDVAGAASPALDEACFRMLQKDPAHRPSLHELDGLCGAPSVTAIRGVAGGDLVGRSEETAEIARLLSRSAHGARLVALRGSSGVGKTALLEWALRHAARRGDVVVRGCARPAERVAFNAVTGAIDDLARALAGAPHAEISTADIAIAVASFPVLAAAALEPAAVSRELVRSRLFRPAEAATRAARRGVFDAVAGLLRSAATGRTGVVLAIDDFHWSDVDSMALLGHLFEHAGPKLSILLAVRDDVEPGPWEAWLAMRPETVTLQVAPLDEVDIASVVRRAAQRLGAHPSAASVAAAARTCAGRPFQAEVAGRALATALAGGKGALEVAIDRASPADRSLLALLVAADEWTPLPDLAALLGAPLGEIDDAVRGLARQGLVRRGGMGDLRGTVDIYHQGVRAALLRALDAQLVVRAHGLLADHLSAAGSSRSPRLVRHLLGAGRLSEAALLARGAARAAGSHGAFGLAADMYAVALRVAASDTDALLEARAGALERAGRYADAVGCWAELAARSEGERRVDLMLRHTHALIAANRVADGIDALDETLRAAGEHTAGAQVASALATGARLLIGALRPRRTPRPGDARLVARAERNVKIGLLLSFVDPLSGLGFLQRAQATFDRADLREQAAACDYLFAALVTIGSRSRDRSWLAERYRRIAGQRLMGLTVRPEVRGMPAFLDGLVALKGGHWEDGAASMREAARIFEGAEGITERMMATSFATMAAVYRQDLPAMVDHLAWFRRSLSECGGSMVIAAHVELLAGYVLQLQGRFGEARATLQSLVDMFRDYRPNAQRAGALLYRHMPRIYLDGGPAARRALLRDMASTRRYRFLGTMYAGPFAAIAALIEANALRAGDAGASPRRLERYARIVDEAPPFMAGTSFRARAYAADARGQRETALAHLVRAEDEASRFGRRLDAAIASYQRGLRLGGDEGRALQRRAEALTQELGAGAAILREDAGLR